MTATATATAASSAVSALLKSLGYKPSVVAHSNKTAYTVDVPGTVEVLIGTKYNPASKTVEAYSVVSIDRLPADASAALTALLA